MTTTRITLPAALRRRLRARRLDPLWLHLNSRSRCGHRRANFRRRPGHFNPLGHRCRLGDRSPNLRRWPRGFRLTDDLRGNYLTRRRTLLMQELALLLRFRTHLVLPASLRAGRLDTLWHRGRSRGRKRSTNLRRGPRGIWLTNDRWGTCLTQCRSFLMRELTLRQRIRPRIVLPATLRHLRARRFDTLRYRGGHRLGLRLRGGHRTNLAFVAA